MEIVAQVDVGARGLVALTFDDGPSQYTPPILELLASHRARATFFVEGQAIAGNEETLRRTAREGHELANHAWSHPRPGARTDQELRDELRRTSRAIRDAAGVDARLVRPPYGTGAARYARIGAELRLAPTVLWSVDGYDYQEVAAEDIVTFVRSAIRPGAIVLLHDGRRAQRPTVEALATILADLAARDYRSLTVSELLAAAKTTADQGAAAP